MFHTVGDLINVQSDIIQYINDKIATVEMLETTTFMASDLKGPALIAQYMRKLSLINSPM